jgi:hypothetical protein
MAALGTVSTKYDTKRSVCIMATGTIANVAAPTLATDGVAGYPGSLLSSDEGCCFSQRDARESTLLIKGRCTAAEVLVGTFTLWGYHVESAAWYEIPVNGGTVGTPVALAETSPDQINFQQRFTNLGHYDRIALELAAIGGAGATFEAWLVTGRSGVE